MMALRADPVSSRGRLVIVDKVGRVILAVTGSKGEKKNDPDTKLVLSVHGFPIQDLLSPPASLPRRIPGQGRRRER